MEEGIQRRIYERVRGSFSGRYSTKDTKDSGELSGLNVGAGGIMVSCDNKISENKMLELWLTSDKVRDPIYTTGQIAWQKEVAPGKWHAGVKLYRPNFMDLSHLMEFSID